jgi:dsRNA-specific ribonuclease
VQGRSIRDALAARLPHVFARPELLLHALTHRSAADPRKQMLDSNERLEFVGDRVLGLCIAEWLAERFPDEREGDLAKRLSMLVSADTLCKVAEELGLGADLRMPARYRATGLMGPRNLLSDTFEAVLGAIYLDGGMAPARALVRRCFAGLIEAEGGTCFLQPGATLRVLDQEPDLSGYADVMSYVEAGLGPADDAHRARYLLESLGMSGAEAPAALSGGEARRAALARALAPSPDILLLDEPTNHLDMATKEMLISALAAYEGTMLFVSHDRHFLAALSNRVLELTPEGIHDFAGGYTEYVARTGQEAPGLRS